MLDTRLIESGSDVLRYFFSSVRMENLNYCGSLIFDQPFLTISSHIRWRRDPQDMDGSMASPSRSSATVKCVLIEWKALDENQLIQSIKAVATIQGIRITHESTILQYLTKTLLNTLREQPYM
jgi:hypothetical protein